MAGNRTGPYWREPVGVHPEGPFPPKGRYLPGRVHISVSPRAALLWLVVLGFGVLEGIASAGHADSSWGWLLFVGTVVVFLAHVLHETAHVVTAYLLGEQDLYLRFGIRSSALNWGRPGGAYTPRNAALIAAAGPLATLTIGVSAGLVAIVIFAFGDSPGVAYGLLASTIICAVLFVFNGVVHSPGATSCETTLANSERLGA